MGASLAKQAAEARKQADFLQAQMHVAREAYWEARHTAEIDLARAEHLWHVAVSKANAAELRLVTKGE